LPNLKSLPTDLSIEPHCYKVFPGTEDKIYNDVFFKRQNLIVNALDNVEARRYVDSRCVSNMKPLLESGTLGTKGHVQVIIPEVTESYGSQRDPPERDVPYCTLKSFPATIEHTIQWARDKFESLWSQMPSLYVKFWKTHQNSPSDVLEKMNSSVVPDGSVKVIKLLCSRPKSWGDCVQMGRIKFEKYFKHKAFDLLNAFPLDTKMPDGSMFWQSPKRPPLPIDFSGNNPLHILFVTSYARLYAEVWGISYTSQDLSVDSVMALIDTAVIPQYKPSGKKIETDESVKKPEVDEISDDMITTSKQNLKQFIQTNNQIKTDWLVMFPQSFEKDDDDNGHIDFITAASNLRAVMYSIDIADRFKTKLIAGRIVPAIATTTAAVAGLVSLELLKLAMSLPIESHRNAFMNLALPQLPLILSEPAPCPKTTICGDISYTLWTQWDIRGDPSMTLQEFLNAVKMRYKLEPTMVVLGVKMIYVPLIPGHRKRLTQTMDSLLKVKGKEYVDLTLSFSDDATGDDVPGPPVRYYLK
jgi:ubiquitin-activating enzyme E1-like protein 2